MPQLNLYQRTAPHAIQWRYQLDPLRPEVIPSLTIIVEDAKGAPIDMSFAQVPFSVVWEAVADVLDQSWQAYLFGEVGDVRKVTAARMKRWRAEAGSRPLL